MKKFVPTIFIIACIVGVLYYIQIEHHRLTDYFMVESRTPKDFPAIRHEDDFLTRKECAELSSYIQNHKLLSESKLGAQFKGTYGFKLTFRGSSIKYDVENIKKLYNVDFGPIYDVYKKIKHPEANAFLFNPLVINTTCSEVEEESAGAHYDVTLDVRSFGRWVTPLCTTVVYVDVPDEFELGRLGMLKFGVNDMYSILFTKPKTGRKVTFRGDMYHYVETMYTKTPKKRISLVFEQYKLTAEEIHKYAELEMD